LSVKLFDGLGVLMVLAALACIGGMVATDFGVGAPERIALSSEDLADGFRPGQEWQSIYLRGQKVGYMELRKELRDDGYHMESRMVLHMTVMKTRRRIVTRFEGNLSPDLILRDFTMQIESPPASVTIEGVVEGNDVVVDFTSAGNRQQERVTLSEPPRMSFSLRTLFLAHVDELKPGQEAAMRFFDPGSMTEREVVIRYEGKEMMVVMDQEVEAFRLTQRMGNTEFAVWVNAIGEVLKEELPMGLEGVRESEAEARYGVTTGTAAASDDIIDAVAVAPRGLPFSATARSARLRLSGLDFTGFHLDGGRQRWTPEAEPTSGTLELRLEPFGDRKDVTIGAVAARIETGDALGAELRAATQPEMLLQSDHPRIHSRALRESGVGESSELAGASVLGVSRKVADWVYEAVEKKNVIGVPSALETLGTLEGDCNEHATLTTALLRSIGVPARMAVGIAYLASQGRFFYHAWVEVWAGDWVAIDPTFGQAPADIGHVRFVTGGIKDQVEMFRVIGKLDLEVKEAE